MRARNIKPGIFKNEILGSEDPIYSLLFEGLWCLADREGRLEDRPIRIKGEVFPYRGNLDVNGYLTDLQRWGFILRYQVDGQNLILVLNFNAHQSPHHTERASVLPPPSIDNIDRCCVTVNSPLPNGGNPPDSLIPDSLIQSTNTTPSATLPGLDLVSESKSSKKEKKKQKLAPYRDDVVAMVLDWETRWPAERQGKKIRNDVVATASLVEGVLSREPELDLATLDEAVSEWLTNPGDYPNAMEFWFGPGKNGVSPPWERAVRAVLTRRKMGVK